MRTRSQTRNLNRQQQAPPAVVESFNLEEPFDNPPLVPMADNRTMAELLQAPTEGYEDAIVIPEINANFELKHGLINLVQNKQFFGHDKEDPHAHIRYFNKITSTMRFPDVPSTSIKLMLFPFSLEGSARIWLEKEPPRSILTWDDLVSKFINQFFPPSKTTNLRNEITRFQQRFDESFYEAWDRFNDLLRACPHHGFSELHQLDTFYNALNANDQDSLNSAAGGNFLDKMPRECLKIIESKSKVRNSRNKAVVAKVSSNSSTPGISPDVAALTTEVSELKNMMKTMLIDKQKAQAPVPVKAVEQSCVTCGGAHSYRNSPQYTVHHPIFNVQNDLLNSQNKLMEQMTSICDMCCGFVPIPSESEGISDGMCDVLLCENPTPLKAFKNHYEIFVDSNNDGTSSNDDSYENIEYVEASLLNLEYDSLEEVNEDQEEEEFDLEDIFQIQDVILREKLLNISRLVTNIESLKDNPTPVYVFKSPSSFPIPVMDSDSFFEKSDTSLSHLDNSLPEFEIFSEHTEETRSGSTTTHANYSPEYDSFLFEIEPNQGGLTGIVISDNSNNLPLELPKFESFHYDLDPSFPCPPLEPLDVEINLIIETDAPEINNVDELNEDECFDPGGGENNVEVDDSFTIVTRTFSIFLPT
ncbi:reverse transcriptase domain-containing protein [Tanacetum coccineum]